MAALRKRGRRNAILASDYTAWCFVKLYLVIADVILSRGPDPLNDSRGSYIWCHSMVRYRIFFAILFCFQSLFWNLYDVTLKAVIWWLVLCWWRLVFGEIWFSEEDLDMCKHSLQSVLVLHMWQEDVFNRPNSTIQVEVSNLQVQDIMCTNTTLYKVTDLT